MRKKKIFWGVFFILAAVLVITSKLGIMPDINVFSILATLFILWVSVQGIRHANFFEILLPIACLCIIYDEPLGIEALTPWTVLAAAFLLSAGLSLLFHDKKWAHRHMDIRMEKHHGKKDAGSYDYEQCIDEHMHCENNLGAVIRYVNSNNFRDAHLENNFGSMTIYFDNALIQEGEAYVEVENNFGQTILYIPKEWQVHTDISRAFGNVSQVGSCAVSGAPKLYIHGETNFGQIELHYI
ncbi:MAG: cell wall-active antibiotics response protein [Bacillus sp. (in: Bacteria)]|nr:cell wall-active antibiotics response protein [Bacillus sp. (in: firmicutes)]MCM1425160.1 cell wall-active antibiotics response protein [Eubacterium sp.]